MNVGGGTTPDHAGADDHGTTGARVEPAELAALVERVPQGWTQVHFRGRRWGVRRTDHAGGRSVAIAAEELGGSGWVSTNVLHLSSGALLKPCEMPAEQVLEFLGGWTPASG